MAKLSNNLAIGLTICFPLYLWFIGWENSEATAIYLIAVGTLRIFSRPSKNKTSTEITAKWLLIWVPISLGILVLIKGSGAGLLYPAIINLGLLLIFYSSLSTPVNFIQRIAEKIENQPLNSIGVMYTRVVTWVWCVFFALNVLISLFLSWNKMLNIWALYNGVIAYLLIGILLLGERLVRNRVQKMMSRSSVVVRGFDDR